jgi:hypothetical protein
VNKNLEKQGKERKKVRIKVTEIEIEENKMIKEDMNKLMKDKEISIIIAKLK